MARSSKSEPTESGAAGEPQDQVKRPSRKSGATRPDTKSTRAAPRSRGTNARERRARAEPAPEGVREVTPAKVDTSEAIEAAVEPRLPEVMRLPDVEPLSPAPLIAMPAEVRTGERVAELAPEPAPPAEPAKAGSPETVGLEATKVAAHVVDAQAASVVVPDVMYEMDRLRAITLAYWQDHLARTMAAGQAIMACGSARAAVRLQMTYLQSSVASGIAHAGGLARLSTEIARDMISFRGR